MAEARSNETEQWEMLHQEADELLQLPANGAQETPISAADEKEILQEAAENAAAKTLAELQLVEKLETEMENKSESAELEIAMETDEETATAPAEAPAQAPEPAAAVYENLSPESVEPPPATMAPAPASLPAPQAMYAQAAVPLPVAEGAPPNLSAFQPFVQPLQQSPFAVPPPHLWFAQQVATQQPWALSAIAAALKPQLPDPASFGNQGFE
ncbi:hypothetical protein AAVH_32574, partial [Aphelenchoides avenae]